MYVCTHTHTHTHTHMCLTSIVLFSKPCFPFIQIAYKQLAHTLNKRNLNPERKSQVLVTEQLVSTFRTQSFALTELLIFFSTF